MAKSLLDKTTHLMKELDLPSDEVREICKQLDRSPKWYSLVMNGQTKNPGVVTTEQLYALLSEIRDSKAA